MQNLADLNTSPRDCPFSSKFVLCLAQRNPMTPMCSWITTQFFSKTKGYATHPHHTKGMFLISYLYNFSSGSTTKGKLSFAQKIAVPDFFQCIKALFLKSSIKGLILHFKIKIQSNCYLELKLVWKWLS